MNNIDVRGRKHYNTLIKFFEIDHLTVFLNITDFENLATKNMFIKPTKKKSKKN